MFLIGQTKILADRDDIKLSENNVQLSNDDLWTPNHGKEDSKVHG